MKYLAWLGLMLLVGVGTGLVFMVLSGVAPIDLYIARTGCAVLLVHIVWKQWQGTWMP